jgi:hypothetical protein
MLQFGGASLGLNLAGLWQAQLAAKANGSPAAAPIRSCIIVFYYGGPSHLDTYDLKPQAPADVRGEFQPIATTVPRLFVCEHLPRMARLMHKVALVRSMHHTNRLHDSHVDGAMSLRGNTAEIEADGQNNRFAYAPAIAIGTLAAVEAADGVAFGGTVKWDGVLAVIENADAAAFNGLVGLSGVLAAVEAGDTAAFVGNAVTYGILAAVEPNFDTASFTGAVATLGVLHGLEITDTFAAVGAVSSPGIISGSLTATEAGDVPAFAGQVTGVVGILAANEAADTAGFIGTVQWFGALAAVDLMSQGTAVLVQ